MESLGGNSPWLVAAIAAAIGFALGRMTAGGVDREETRMRAAEASRSALASLTPDKQSECDRLIRGKKSIEAIKFVRAETGLGLKESKDAVGERRRQFM